VWEIYHNINSLRGKKNVLEEVASKGLTESLSAYPELSFKIEERFESESENEEIAVLAPEIVGRDIYLPIKDGGEKFLLALKERDPELPQKEKELFWILYSQATKERHIARFIYWVLVGLSGVLMLLNLLKNVIAVGIMTLTVH